MNLSAEISLYPLADKYLEEVRGFIERLNQYEGIECQTNAMSTQVFGAFDAVYDAIGKEMKNTAKQLPNHVLVVKFIPKDLRP